MSHSLAGKVVLVAGGSRGLRVAITRTLAAEGARAPITDPTACLFSAVISIIGAVTADALGNTRPGPAVVC